MSETEALEYMRIQVFMFEREIIELKGENEELKEEIEKYKALAENLTKLLMDRL